MPNYKEGSKIHHTRNGFDQCKFKIFSYVNQDWAFILNLEKDVLLCYLSRNQRYL